jgi:hypothetical protein
MISNQPFLNGSTDTCNRIQITGKSKSSRFILITGIMIMMLTISQGVSAQVLISLLFGDALNSEKIEFGLTGGYNRSWIYDIPESEGLNNFNLGFYFLINLKNNSYLSTGVLVKSNVGANGMPTYPLGDPNFDELYAEGTLTKKIHYFYVPILFHQRFSNRWYIEGGFQLGLRNKANDIFEEEALDGDLSYKRDVRDQYQRIDAGLAGGIGYKFKKQTKSLAAGITYYYGLMNVSDLEAVTVKNSSLYLYIRVPIGAGSTAPGENNK